jgi:RNA polymerase sigma factor (sigma-70 family)
MEVWLVVAALPLRQRTAVALRHIGDLTESEIARAMGITRSTVSSTLSDAHRTLAGVLAEEDVHDV